MRNFIEAGEFVYFLNDQAALTLFWIDTFNKPSRILLVFNNIVINMFYSFLCT